MNIRLYKFAIIIELLLVILFTVILFTNPFWAHQSTLEINFIYPNEFYVTLGSLFILVIISFLLSLVITAIFKNNPIENKSEQDTIKKIRNFNFWKFTFLTKFSFVSCLLIYSLFLKFTTKHEIVIYDPNTFLRNYLIFSLGILILSFFIGALYLSADTLWKTNKLFSFIIGIVIILFFIFPFLSVSKYHSYCENYQPIVFNDSLPDESPTYEENYNEGDYNDRDFSFAHLWDDSSEDEQNVSTALEYFFLRLFSNPLNYNNESAIKERGDFKKMNTYLFNQLPESQNLFGYLINEPVSWIEDIDDLSSEKEEDKDVYFLGNIIAEIREQSESVDIYFEKYKHLLYTLIDKKLYKKSSSDRIIKLLINSYNDLKSSGISDEEKEKLYRKFAYNESLGKNDPDYNGPGNQLAKMESYFSESGMDKTKTLLAQEISEDVNDDVFYNLTFWSYSFWIRRHYDGNEEQVYKILTQIDKHYEE